MMRAKSQLVITTATHHMPRMTVPITGTTPWKLDLKVKRVGIVEYKGKGSDYIVVRPLETAVSGGTLKSGSLSLPQDTLRTGNSAGSWNINQASTAVLTGTGTTTLTFNVAHEVNAKVTGGLLTNYSVCWRAGQANGDNGNSINCNPAINDDQGIFLEGTFSYLHHLRYEFDPAAASTCNPLPVTVKACSDDQASCGTLYTGGQEIHPTATAASGSFTWASNPLLIPDSGSVTTQLRGSLGNVAVTLGAQDLPVQCFSPTGTPISCTLPGFAQCSLGFQVIDGYNQPWGPAKPHNIYTKLAGVAFPGTGINVALINQTAAPVKDSSYRGTPRIELVDGNSGTGCADRTVLQTLPPVAYTATDAGERNFAVTYANAVARAQFRVSDADNDIAASCSDAFTIRPAGLSLASSALASNGQKFKAGSDDFNLVATAMSGAAAPITAAGYNGTLKIDSGKLHGLRTDKTTPAAATGALNLLQFPVATAGIASLNDLTYSETGYFKLEAYAIHDDSFTQTDQNAGNCAPGFGNTVSSGKYGCNFGYPDEAIFGLFHPDHFELATPAACASSNFSYSGQPFLLTLTAKNGLGDTTRNYNHDDGYAHDVHLSVAAITPAAAGTLAPTQLSNADFIGGSASTTSAQFSFSQPTEPSEITLHAVENGGDGVISDPDATMNIWSGRLRLQNAAGPNHLELYVPMHLERFAGASQQWQPNAQDHCTTMTLQPLQFLSLPSGSTCVQDDGQPGASGQGCTTPAATARRYQAQPGNLATPSADFNLWLAPPLNSAGAVEISPNAPGWLSTNKATATFGNVKSRPIIYRKEQF